LSPAAPCNYFWLELLRFLIGWQGVSGSGRAETAGLPSKVLVVGAVGAAQQRSGIARIAVSAVLIGSDQAGLPKITGTRAGELTV